MKPCASCGKPTCNPDAWETTNKELETIKETAEDIMSKAHLRGDQFVYELMRTVLGLT